MVYIVATIISILIILFFILKYILGTPYKHKGISPDRLKEYISTLYKRGFNHSFMIIENPRKEFIQFKKYISKDGITLKSGFVKVKWNNLYFDAILKYLDQNHYIFDLSEEEGVQILEVSLDEKIDRCVELVIGINECIFQLEQQDMNFTIWFENITPEDKFITK